MSEPSRRFELGSPDQVRVSSKRSMIFGVIAVIVGIAVMALTTRLVLSIVVILFGAANLAGAIAMRRWADRSDARNSGAPPQV